MDIVAASGKTCSQTSDEWKSESVMFDVSVTSPLRTMILAQAGQRAECAFEEAMKSEETIRGDTHHPSYELEVIFPWTSSVGTTTRPRCKQGPRNRQRRNGR